MMTDRSRCWLLGAAVFRIFYAYVSMVKKRDLKKPPKKGRFRKRDVRVLKNDGGDHKQQANEMCSLGCP
jgi:hypothetical protein